MMEGRNPDFLPRFAPHLFRTRQSPTKGRRRIRISRSSPLRGESVLVGEILVQIEDDDANTNVEIPLPSLSQQTFTPPSPPGRRHPRFPMPNPTTHPFPDIQASIAALYKKDPAQAAAAFDAHRRANPAGAAAVLGSLFLGNEDEMQLEHFLYWDVCFLMLRMRRRTPDFVGHRVIRRPRQTYHSLSCMKDDFNGIDV
ncbi:hypothetical protein NLJ89_g10947 [Agrocybe chaxingu]|uniref:Uncharacterized protein n=1 Tax=Agrocybe chaxingu TaxID=84603 RepID=A0A9W8MPT8_9AGAR|nr:hypothetical protein NLJ89_g10947 [Agrocybe chaxingu]